MASRQTSPAWRREFLRVLSETANITLAIDAVKVGRNFIYRQRNADPAFAVEWAEAISHARAAIAQSGAVPPRRSRGARASAELVIEGSSGRGTLRATRARPGSMTIARRHRFLDHLAATCNVTAAADHAGLRRTTLYAQRRECQAFRDEWNAAAQEGRIHLDLVMLGAAIALFAPPASSDESTGDARAAPPPPAVTGMDARVALQLLRLHDPRGGRGGGRGHGWRLKPADPEAARASILAKLAALRSANGGE